MKKHNILIVHNYYQISGGEDMVVVNEKKMLEEHGNRVYLYTRNNSELNTAGVREKLLLPLRMVFNWRTYHDLCSQIMEKEIDVVHVHNTLMLVSPSVYYAAVHCKVPVVQTIHNFRMLCPSGIFYRNAMICEDCAKNSLWCAVLHKCYRSSRLQTLACVINTKIQRMTGIYKKIYYICLTDFNKENLLRLNHPGRKMIIDPDKVFVKPNVIFEGITKEKELEVGTRDYYVYAGRLEEIKGVRILLESWRLMGTEAPKLFIYGNGSLETWCREQIKKQKLFSIEMKGFCPNQEVKHSIGKGKALIMPTQWYEGFPMTILEAFSKGTPVIVSDLGNAGDLVKEGINGCKFIPNSPEELVQAVKRLEQYPFIRKTTREEYLVKYSAAENYRILHDIYNKAIINAPIV